MRPRKKKGAGANKGKQERTTRKEEGNARTKKIQERNKRKI